MLPDVCCVPAVAAAAGWALACALLFQLVPIVAAYHNSPEFSLSHVLQAVTANIHLVRGARCDTPDLAMYVS